MVFTITTIVFLPMSFIASVFAIPVRDFPHEDGGPSIPFSYVSKIMFGIGLSISIPLIAVAFAVDNLGLLIKRALQSLIFWKRGPPSSVAKKRTSTQPSDMNDNELKVPRLGRKSQDTSRRGYSYETDNEGDLIRRSVGRTFGYSKDTNWMNGGRASRDLEKGGGAPQKYERSHS